MDGIFGIGIPEILIVVVLALIILGPQDMVATARKLGRWVYRVYHSPTWRMIMSTSQELRELPTKFVREAGLEDTVEEIKQTTADVKSQLKEARGDVSAGLKEVTSDASAELKEARQELGAETQAVAALAQPEAVLPPAAPDPAPAPEPAPPSPAADPAPAPPLDEPPLMALADPNGNGNGKKEVSSTVQPEPFAPRREQPETQNSNPEEFTI